ncbi:hemolysin D [Chryseomicrobium excrementi]|uniref:Hemolysin D n=1 Tax=Chryseomicrobium excrementi TaxID=2041346 RepID=A0A2M9EYN5_9BACL|nr:hemolysin III family protein [Chryseomicrobium excrementi]PJK16309.1 hemolysin D [Chryseomicrobium excrementi]
MDTTHTFTKREELLNALIHGLGALLSVAALVVLIVAGAQTGDAWHIVSFTVFGTSMLILYTSSTLVHSFPEGKAKDWFEWLDHSSIYWFIAGTYTPFLFLAVEGALAWVLFGIVWALAIGGTLFKLYFVKRFVKLSTFLYVVMGWLIVFAWNPLTAAMTQEGLWLLIAGGVLYTVGAIFYVWRGFLYHHAVWHVFVLAASVCHFFSVYSLLSQ